MVDVLPQMIDALYPKGARFLVVLLGDPDGGVATQQGCNNYLADNGLAGDERIVFALDPTGNARNYYDGYTATSVSIITDEKTRIIKKEAFDQAASVQYHVERSLEEYFEALATQE